MQTKKLLFVLLGTIAMGTIHAQYKKASFFTKKGRFYDLGATARIQGGGRSSSFGGFYSFGKENEGKRVHHWYDLEILSGTKFNYTTMGEWDFSQPIVVKGRGPVEFSFKYNWAYYLLDNSDANNKVLPFFHLTIGLTGGLSESYDYTTDPETYDLEKYPATNGRFLGGGGIGVVYAASEKIGIRLSANYMRSFKDPFEQRSDDGFLLINNPAAVNLAIRFRFPGAE